MKFDKSISVIEKKISYTFKDKSLLRQAFTRTSYSNEHKDRRNIRYQSNEVLEFFGDSLLSAAIVTLLMRDFGKRYEYGISTELCEGDFSNIKSRLSDKKNLSLATEKLGLQEFLLMGEGDAKLGIENEPSVMEDLFESIIGAIYIDSGNDMRPVIASVSKMLDVKGYLDAKNPPMQSFKNAIQEWCADKKHRKDAPLYKTVSESGPDHKKIYERACIIGGKVYGTGYGKNQKIADAAAAEAALTALIAEFERESSLASEAIVQESLVKLKEYAARCKKPSAEFHDLGETPSSTVTAREYEIECRFDGIKVTACAKSKREAKAKAAEEMLKRLKKQTKAAKNSELARPVSKNAGKRSSSSRSKRIRKIAKTNRNRKPESK